MTIELLDWMIYIVFVIIIWLLLPKEFKEELGCFAGIFIILIFTVIYCIIFWHYSWADDIFPILNLNFHVKW